MKKANERYTAYIMRLFCVGLALCGIAFFGFALPEIGSDLAAANPEFAYCRLPWLIFLWVDSIPCFAVLVLVWRLSVNIRKKEVFSVGNSKIFGAVAALTLGDTVFFLLGNFVFLLLNMSHPGILIGALFASFLGLGFGFCCGELSRYMRRAAALQEQSDYTI